MKFALLLLLPTLAFAKGFMPGSFSSKYEEISLSASGKEKKTFGELDYKYPGNLRLQIAPPVPSTLVVNPQKTWLYQPAFSPKEKGQVTLQKTGSWPLIRVLDSLKNGVEVSKFFTHQYKGKELILKFAASVQKESGLKQAILTADKDAKTVQKLKEFEKMTIEYNDGKKVTLKFLDLKEDVSFDGSHFTFKIPDNTKTVSQ